MRRAKFPSFVRRAVLLGCVALTAPGAQPAAGDAAPVKSGVTLAPIDAPGVARLARNDSGRLRLVNVWATWCEPCAQEFPDLVALARRFGDRDFELVTISVDHPRMEPQVRQFLERQQAVPSPRLRRLLAAEGRPTLNFLYNGASGNALVNALDPAWTGPLPHSVLIAPGGRIVWRHNGPVNPAELKNKLLELLGPFSPPE